jgi:membrane fusion protein, multidrug efflux system
MLRASGCSSMKSNTPNDDFGCGRAIRCPVELRASGCLRQGTARAINSSSLQVEFKAEGYDGLLPGRIVEIGLIVSPVGPKHTNARIASVEDATDDTGQPVISVSLDFLEGNGQDLHIFRRSLELIKPVLLSFGLDHPWDEETRAEFRVVTATTIVDVTACFDSEEIAVFVLGPGLPPSEAHKVLCHCLTEFPGNPSINIVLNMGPTEDLFQPLVDEDRVFYLSRGSLSKEQLRSIVIAAAKHFATKVESKHASRVIHSAAAGYVIELCRQLSRETSLPEVGPLVIEAVKSILKADRAQCLIYDSDSETIWSACIPPGEEHRNSAATGLVGYVTRTGEHIQVNRLGSDPRYDSELDDPNGDEASHFLAEPLLDIDNSVIGVLTAARHGKSSQFSAEDAAILKFIAASVAPSLSVILSHINVSGHVSEVAQAALRSSELFRQEAVEYHTGNLNQEGELLKGLPSWLTRSHLFILVFAVAGFAYTLAARMEENASGPAMIRAKNKIIVSALTTGMVRSVAVSVGDIVRKGDLLVQLQSAPGDNLLTRVKQEVRATADGVVGDIRVRSGQEVGPGDQVASIIDESSGYQLIAFLPGSYAPQIHSGMSAVLKLQGYPDSNEIILIDDVATEILGPQEASRFAGKESTGALDVTGPVLMVRSSVRQPTFEANGLLYNYRDGMVGDTEISVRSDPMIVSLIPGLKDLLNNPQKLLRVK